MYSTQPRKLVAQACDACRRRKIKCNGLQPCPSCRSAVPELACIFTIVPRRGGNRGARATVLNELRESQSRIQTAYASVNPGSPHSSVFQNTFTPVVEHSPSLDGSGVLEPGAIDACINAYLERIYPVVPFLTEEILRTEALHSASSLLSRQFIVSFCAYVVTFGKVLGEAYTSTSDLGTQLLNSALRIQTPERVSTQTRQSVFISFFLYGAYAGLGMYRQGWFYLREATTLFMLQKNIEDEQSWYSPNVHRCLFWVLVVSERYALPLLSLL